MVTHTKSPVFEVHKLFYTSVFSQCWQSCWKPFLLFISFSPVIGSAYLFQIAEAKKNLNPPLNLEYIGPGVGNFRIAENIEILGHEVAWSTPTVLKFDHTTDSVVFTETHMDQLQSGDLSYRFTDFPVIVMLR